MEDNFYMDDKKSEKFKLLAKKRMPKVLNMMKLIENLSNTYQYNYNKKQVEKITKDIDEMAKSIKSSFNSGLDKQKKQKKIDDYEI
tara:strand:+ start:141 stop:398 length:258 start_codon:yes stop_codon:yes gene_type:complete